LRKFRTKVYSVAILRNTSTKKNLPFINIDWVLTGDGEMFLGESPPAEVKELEPVYNLDPLAPRRSLLDRINEMEERLDRVEKHLNL